MGIINTLVVFKVLKMLVTKWKDFDAFKLGLIDKNGNRIKSKGLNTAAEKEALDMLTRLVFNIKRIIQKVPFGKTAFASYAIALALLKEQQNLNAEQMEELCEKFYRHLKDENVLEPEMLSEAHKVGTLDLGETYNLKRQLKQNFDEQGEFIIYPEKTPVHILQEHSLIYGITCYIGYIDEHRVLVTQDDVY
jgi:hypothetical protein